ncbi:MAG: hypothetical protein ACWA6Y_07355 [Polaromonas sp.]
MKNKSKCAMAGLPALLLVGSLMGAMQPAMAQTQSLDVGEDSGVREQPASSAAAKTSQSQASARLAPSVSAVKAPPRPKGSDQVIIGAGLNPLEIKRQKRAHNASKIVKKDPTRDDSVDAPTPPKKK